MQIIDNDNNNNKNGNNNIENTDHQSICQNGKACIENQH